MPEEEDVETARARITEMIEQQVNDVKEKLDGVKVKSNRNETKLSMISL